MNLRMATLNAWALPEPIAPDVEARMAAIADALPAEELDVVAFQEIFRGDSLETLLRAGEQAGLSHSWHRGGGIGEGGLLVLSRLPILEARFERYEVRGHAEAIGQGEYLSGKGFARLRLATDEGPIGLITTHLHARYSASAAHQYTPHRTGQIVQLARQAVESKDPIVVLGDFNFVEKDPEYTILTGLTGVRDVAAELDRRDATASRRNPYRHHTQKPDRRIDFVFVRDGRERVLHPQSTRLAFDEPLEIGGKRKALSNHSGVVADLKLAPRQAAKPPFFDRRAVELASALLAKGRAEAERMRAEHRRLAGAGLGLAIVAAAGNRTVRTRRSFLRSTVSAMSLAALAPGVGFSILSEVYRPDEIDAFEDAAERLAYLERWGSLTTS